MDIKCRIYPCGEKYWSVCYIDSEYRVWHLADFRYKEDAELFAKHREEAGSPTQDQDMQPHTGQCPWPTKEAES